MQVSTSIHKLVYLGLLSCIQVIVLMWYRPENLISMHNQLMKWVLHGFDHALVPCLWGAAVSNHCNSQPRLYRPAVDSRRKMTVRTLNDCRLVIVIFSSSCVKNDGRRREGNRDGDSALAGLEHLLLAGGSSHIVVAAGRTETGAEV